MKVWVAGVDLKQGGGFATVNRTDQGAKSAVLDWLTRLGIDVGGDFGRLDFEPEVESFYCWHMPVGE